MLPSTAHDAKQNNDLLQADMQNTKSYHQVIYKCWQHGR